MLCGKPVRKQWVGLIVQICSKLFSHPVLLPPEVRMTNKMEILELIQCCLTGIVISGYDWGREFQSPCIWLAMWRIKRTHFIIIRIPGSSTFLFWPLVTCSVPPAAGWLPWRPSVAWFNPSEWLLIVITGHFSDVASHHLGWCLLLSAKRRSKIEQESAYLSNTSHGLQDHPDKGRFYSHFFSLTGITSG